MKRAVHEPGCAVGKRHGARDRPFLMCHFAAEFEMDNELISGMGHGCYG